MWFVSHFAQSTSCCHDQPSRFFEPIKQLYRADHPFRQMRVERAGADVQTICQLRSGERLCFLLGLKGFCQPCVRALSPCPLLLRLERTRCL
jgi:hypothetical protein